MTAPATHHRDASPPPSVPAEERFVLALAGVDDEADAGEVKARLERHAAIVAHWAAVIAVAHQQGALPLLARLAAAGAIPAMPQNESVRLQRMAPLALLRAGVIEARLGALAEAFDKRGVPLVLLKGAALATTVYRRFADRTMGDLDLLVPVERGAEAFDIALGLGWQPGAAAIDDDAFSGHQHLRPLHDGTGLGIGLDLHTHLVRPGAPTPIDEERFRRSAHAWGRSVAAVPVVEDLLLHACIHFAWSHSLGSGAWKAFRDVRQLLRQPGFDEARFERCARESRAESCVYWTLHLAHELGDVAEAGTLRHRFATSTPRLLSGLLTRHFAATLTDRSFAELPGRLHRRAWELAMQPDRHRHGAARPWDRDAEFVRSSDAPSASSRDAADVAARNDHVSESQQRSLLPRLRSVYRYVRTLAG